MYALIDFKGFQYKVEKGQLLDVPYLGKPNGDEIEISSVMLLKNDNDIKIGQPYIENVKIKAKIINELKKDKKVIVFKYKRRKNYKRFKGHRQRLTTIKIEDIVAN